MSDEELVDAIELYQTIFVKDEWKQVVQMCRPDVTDAEYDALWDALLESKRTSVIHRIK